MSFCSVDEINRSLFAFLVETYHWTWSMAAENNDSPTILQQYLGFTTTRKRFEPGHNLFKFPLVHSAPLNTIVTIMETTSKLVVERLTLVE